MTNEMCIMFHICEIPYVFPYYEYLHIYHTKL